MVKLTNINGELKNAILSPLPLLIKINSKTITPAELETALADLEYLPKRLQDLSFSLHERLIDLPREVERAFGTTYKWLKKARMACTDSCKVLDDTNSKNLLAYKFVNRYRLCLEDFKECLGFLYDFPNKKVPTPKLPKIPIQIRSQDQSMGGPYAHKANFHLRWADTIEQEILGKHSKTCMGMRIALFYVRLNASGEWDKLDEKQRMNLAQQTYKQIAHERTIRGHINSLYDHHNDNLTKHTAHRYIDDARQLYMAFTQL